MTTFNELIQMEISEVSQEQREFINLHKDLVYCGRQAMFYTYEMCKKLKEMRDLKKYAVAGFNSFGEYVENALGIKERQAYNYISVYENLPNDFLQSNSKLGVTKLSLIASLEAQDREDLMKQEDVESMTVKELKKEIESYKKKNEQLSMDLTAIQGELKAVQSEKNTADKEELEKLNKALETAKKDKQNSDAQVIKLKNQIKVLENAPKEIKEVDNPKLLTELETANKSNEELTERISKLEKQIQLASGDENMAKFKVKFKDLQAIGIELFNLLNLVGDDNKEKCKNAIKKVIEGWKL